MYCNVLLGLSSAVESINWWYDGHHALDARLWTRTLIHTPHCDAIYFSIVRIYSSLLYCDVLTWVQPFKVTSASTLSTFSMLTYNWEKVKKQQQQQHSPLHDFSALACVCVCVCVWPKFYCQDNAVKLNSVWEQIYAVAVCVTGCKRSGEIFRHAQRPRLPGEPWGGRQQVRDPPGFRAPEADVDKERQQQPPGRGSAADLHRRHVRLIQITVFRCCNDGVMEGSSFKTQLEWLTDHVLPELAVRLYVILDRDKNTQW